ncbi:hypothetical protein DFH07DRAFT_955848 [Mycena maculata]|uniref:Uncharacterized protein n=1 Tax=Mycena maculata TaxID=230809 RepID=A0AAD7JL07_9AGAR|nr:hypothetical protein DFH07DRAFT_955848 [Mycena maculata]
MQRTDHVLSPCASQRSLTSEVVEDSEPEREALRQAQKLERKRRKLAAVDVVVHSDSMAEKTSVFVVPDGSVPPSPEASSVASQINIIEISDSSTSMSEPVVTANKVIISLHSNAAGTNMSGADVTDIGIVSLYPDVAPPMPSLSDDEEIVPTLKLARFAFANSRPLQRRNSSSVAGSASNSDTQTKAPTKQAARSSSKRLAGDFSDAQLKKLLKCVSCDLAWTARKSGEQKLVHIRSCAKKNGLTDDTVRILIKRELENAPPPDAGTSKGKGKAPPAPAMATTLLEDIVRDAAPKRKGKRKEPVDALKSVAETRKNIRGRAQMLLGSDPFSEGGSFIVHTQAFTATTLTTGPEPGPTQTFGPSRLAQRQGYKLSLLGHDDSDGEPELPPATQVFAPSKLGGRTITTGGWGYASDSGGESSASTSSRRSNNLPPLFRVPSFSAREVSPKSSPRRKGNKSAAAPPSSDEWNDDDAYVHFDPDVNRGRSLEPMETIPTLKPRKPKKIAAGRATKSGKRKISDADEFVNPSLRRTTPKTKRSRKKVDDEFDEEWELGLKDKITQDHDLHLRILRYEPLDFDFFLKIATGGEPAGNRLKFKLREFLDKQAINFYGGEARKSRR